MRRILALAAGSVVLATTLSAAPCAPSEATLCLNDSRFEVEVSWRDSGGRTGVGQAKTITADTGYFWFFSETNIELVIKVLDARSINQKYWVFFGALSNVEYDITVTDTVTGAVKTYHNPLGQFASVGDTGAFDPSVTAPVHETVATEGTQTPPDSLEAIQAFIDASLSKSAEAFTPCPDTGAFLYLANCRFRLDVHWSDERGRHGAGRPVQLTNDTGYFWFFSDTNVELMVKVLDARGISDKFWVFFGALSNVAYTINVFDTVSGALHSYENPQGTFASVGDTAAFRGGYGISFVPDEALAVSGDMTAAQGGSLSVTAADGTLFTLVVPPESLFFDERVTMTPVRSAGNVRFTGGLAAGVLLEPSGTLLMEGATLSIHTPAPTSPSDETAVAWNGSGEDFFLFPPDAIAGDLQLGISHFGGYGIARGTDAERQTQLGREPLSLSDLFSHQISPLLRAGRAATAGAVVAGTRDSRSAAQTTDLRSDLRTRLDAQYQDLKAQMQATTGNPGVVEGLIITTINWIQRVARGLGPLDDEFPGRSDEIESLFKRMMQLALRNIHDRCSENTIAIRDVIPLVQIAQKYGMTQRFPDLRAEIDNVFKCLTFKLQFESVVSTESAGFGVTTDVLTQEITLRGHYVLTDAYYEIGVSGEGEIYHKSISVTGAPDECVAFSSFKPSIFKAKLFWTVDDRIRLAYDRGSPTDEVSVSCRGAAPSVIGVDWWLSGYDLTHREQDTYNSGGYTRIQRNWSMTGNKNPWAISIVATNRSPGGISVAEYTVFTLIHTPE